MYINKVNETTIVSIDDAYINLAAAVIKCAVADINADPYKYKSSQLRLKAIRDKNSAINFFKSAWYSTLTLGRDGRKDLKKVIGG